MFQCEWEETELLESYDVSMLRPSAVESKDKTTNICSQMQHASIKLAKAYQTFIKAKVFVMAALSCDVPGCSPKPLMHLSTITCMPGQLLCKVHMIV